MYIPPYFAATDLERLHAAMEAYSFATLISEGAGNLTASHLPLLLQRDHGENGLLLGHMAKANPQWEQAAGTNVLAVFAGPHAYISPTWYQDEKVVPTWNYVAIHAYGRLELVQDSREKLEILLQTVSVYERHMPVPWSLRESPEFVDRLVDQIVGFQIPLARLEGKWKLNQNHPPARRRRVAAALQVRSDESSQAIAHLMAQSLLSESPP